MTFLSCRTWFGIPFGLWISFEIDSPWVHHFVRTLAFEIFIKEKVMIKECDKKAVQVSKRRTLRLQKRRKGFSPVEFGFRKEEAVQEEQRCLGLRECESCEICGLLCPDLCITRDEKTGEVLIDLDYCKGCGICASVCPKGAIKMVLEEGI